MIVINIIIIIAPGVGPGGDDAAEGPGDRGFW